MPGHCCWNHSSDWIYNANFYSGKPVLFNGEWERARSNKIVVLVKGRIYTRPHCRRNCRGCETFCNHRSVLQEMLLFYFYFYRALIPTRHFLYTDLSNCKKQELRLYRFLEPSVERSRSLETYYAEHCSFDIFSRNLYQLNFKHCSRNISIRRILRWIFFHNHYWNYTNCNAITFLNLNCSEYIYTSFF